MYLYFLYQFKIGAIDALPNFAANTIVFIQKQKSFSDFILCSLKARMQNQSKMFQCHTVYKINKRWTIKLGYMFTPLQHIKIRITSGVGTSGGCDTRNPSTSKVARPYRLPYRASQILRRTPSLLVAKRLAGWAKRRTCGPPLRFDGKTNRVPCQAWCARQF